MLRGSDMKHDRNKAREVNAATTQIRVYLLVAPTYRKEELVDVQGGPASRGRGIQVLPYTNNSSSDAYTIDCLLMHRDR